MSEQHLIVVSGAPGSGKTVLAKRISENFHIPLINKDIIKESLFDSLGWNDREVSIKLGIASIELMFLIAGQILEAGYPLILENNFHRHYDSRRFADLRDKYSLKIIQIHCTANPDEIIRRYRERTESGDRHPGHLDHTRYDNIAAGLAQGIWDPTDIDGRLLEVDTTEFDSVDYDTIFQAIADEGLEPADSQG